ncbi:transcription termination/antitermination protein NusA [Treponema ruminis]|uniref:Transcription termination/antitermination protein NusA n=1 Tax=Treponema ruminis TaxID=744515 RepID=A0A7W8G850_9SPIR|nr:transcription termination factor NusA [Treponema ruminis]MBB5225479.1 N utilization substance protein A [Treponema ruminis]QSI01651.1 transcription termination/antitermination protein NusA [Treponema ruminis]
MSEMADAIRELTQEKGFSLDSVKQTIENTLRAAYKRTFGTADNCIVTFADDMSDVTVASRKTIVDGVYDPVTEIELEDALKLSPECELGDEIDIVVDPKTFDRSAVSVGKQETHKGLNESFKDKLYNEYKDKVGEIIIGYFQREYNGNIYVDLGKVEGVLPKKYQSPREVYNKNDRIKAFIVDLKRISSGLQLVLSRSDPKFVQSILELEVPEIQDKTVEIKKIVRDAGYRTKIAVSTTKEDVDPVGSCVGPKGMRIQNVIRELEGEKIDVLRYSDDPVVFIKNALSPAEVNRVVILDDEKKTALAIVNDEQFSVAIGKNGQNVRLANRLCDWSIDVKTEEQAAEMDLTEITTRRAQELFTNTAAPAEPEEISVIADLPGVNQEVAAKLKEAGYEDIEKFALAYENGELNGLESVTAEELEEVSKIVHNTVEFVEEEEEETSEVAPTEENTAEEEEEYFCPECGAKITLDMTHCPSCGVEFEFEEDEE